MIISSSQLCKNPIFPTSSSSSSFLKNVVTNSSTNTKSFIFMNKKRSHNVSRYNSMICKGLMPFVDPWSPNIDSQSIAPQLFAFSLFPYLGFLYFITKSNSAPKLTLFGFYFLLAFVGATRSIVFVYVTSRIWRNNGDKRRNNLSISHFQQEYTVHYGTSLSNVDWLHGGAESLLTITNLFIVMGLREALRKLSKDGKNDTSSVPSSVEKEDNSSV